MVNYEINHGLPGGEGTYDFGDVPLEQTCLGIFLKTLQGVNPALADRLTWRYDTFREAKRKSLRIQQETEAAHIRNRAANALLDREQAALEADRDQQTGPLRDKVRELEREELAQRAIAVEGITRLTGQCDWDNPTLEKVLHCEPRPDAAIRKALDVILPSNDCRVRLSKAMAWAASLFFGIVVGISLYLFCSGFTLRSADRHLTALLLSLSAGILLAALAKAGLAALVCNASTLYYAKRRACQWVPAVLCAAICIGCFLWLDATFESMGLLKAVRARQHTVSFRSTASAPPDAEPALFLIGMFFSAPFVLAVGMEGYFVGQEHAVNQLVERERACDLEEIEFRREHRLRDPEVQAVIRPLVGIWLFQTAARLVRSIIKEIAAPFETRIDKLERKRLPERLEEDARATALIEQAEAAAQRAKAEWEADVRAALTRYGRPGRS